MIGGIDLGASVDTIKNFISDMNFPAGKQDIVQHAKNKNAPGTVVTILEKIPDQVYQTADAVVDKVRNLV